MLHHSYIEEFHAIYYGALRECLKAFPGELFASSDQCVHSFLYARNPARYCVLGHGYGATVPLLYSDGKAPRLRETT